jgi:hypothetical protein
MARSVTVAAGAGSGGRDRGAPGKITGAFDAKSYTWQGGKRVYGTPPERADRMAGMANGGGQAAAAAQSADMAAKAAMMVVKLLPEIEKHTRRAANKSS